MPKLLDKLLGMLLVFSTGALVTTDFGASAGIAAAIFMLAIISLYNLMQVIIAQLKLMNEELIKRLR